MSWAYNHSQCSGNKRVDWAAFLFSELLIHTRALSQLGHVCVLHLNCLFIYWKFPMILFTKPKQFWWAVQLRVVQVIGLYWRLMRRQRWTLKLPITCHFGTDIAYNQKSWFRKPLNSFQITSSSIFASFHHITRPSMHSQHIQWMSAS